MVFKALALGEDFMRMRVMSLILAFWHHDHNHYHHYQPNIDHHHHYHHYQDHRHDYVCHHDHPHDHDHHDDQGEEDSIGSAGSLAQPRSVPEVWGEEGELSGEHDHDDNHDDKDDDNDCNCHHYLRFI